MASGATTLLMTSGSSRFCSQLPTTSIGLSGMSLSFGSTLEWRNGVDDCLGFLEVGDGQRAAQPADAALLVAALGEAVVEFRPGVRPYRAGLNSAAYPAADADVVGENAGGETEFGGVGARDGVGLGVEDLEGRDRAEDLLLNDVVVDVRDLEQGRPVERSGGQVTLGRRATAYDRLGVGQSRLNHTVDAGNVVLGDERAHLGGGVESIAEADVFKDADQAGADIIGHPALHQDP